MSEWISVEDRLPDFSENKDFLVTSLDNVDGTWPGDIHIKRWYHDHFIIPHYETVTHWMPLPEPPK